MVKRKRALNYHQLSSTIMSRLTRALLCKFILPEVSVVNLFANLRVFVVGLGNSSEFLSFFIEVSEEI